MILAPGFRVEIEGTVALDFLAPFRVRRTGLKGKTLMKLSIHFDAATVRESKK